jgi:hypothetical protein
MANPSFTTEPTAEEVARYVAGIEASSAAITAAIASNAEFQEKRIAIVKNLQFIDGALRNDAIKTEIDLEAITTLRTTAIEAIRPPEAPAAPVVNPLEAHLEELGL